MTPSRRIAAEAFGTALLLAAVVGSGIMGDRLSGGNIAIALLANTLATGADVRISTPAFRHADASACVIAPIPPITCP